MKRRDLLKCSAALLASGALAGCSSDPPEELPQIDDIELPGFSDDPGADPGPGTEPAPGADPASETPPDDYTELDRERASSDRFEFDEVVDAVDDLGMDPEGNEPIDDALTATFDRSVLVEFPPGRYRFDHTHEVENLRQWGVRGTGDSRRDVRFVIGQGRGGLFLNVRSGRDVLVENVTFDMRQSRPEWINNVIQVADGALMKDVEYVGFHPSERYQADGEGYATGLLRMRTTDSDGVNVVDGMVRRGPTDFGEYPLGHAGIAYGGGANSHFGALHIQNSWIENLNQHGTYCSRAPGVTRIERTTFVNCNGVSIRIGGDGSYARDCRVVYDTAHAHPDNRGSLRTATGVIFDGGGDDNWWGHGGATVEDCVLEFRSLDADHGSGAIWVDGSHGAATVRNTHVHNDTDAFTIAAGKPGNEGSRYRTEGRTPERPWGVTLENVEVAGDPDGGDAGIAIDGRHGSTVRGARVRFEDGVDGVRLVRADDCVVSDVDVEVGGSTGLAVRESYGTVLEGGVIRAGGFPILLAFDGVDDRSVLQVRTPPEVTWTNGGLGLLSSGPVARSARELVFDEVVRTQSFDGPTQLGVVDVTERELQVI